MPTATPSGTPISGTEGRVQIVGNNCPLEDWTVTPTAGDVNTFNFESGGYDEGIGGKLGADIEFSGYYNSGQSPFAGLSLTPFAIIGPIKLYVSKLSNKFFNFPLVRVLSVPVTNKAENDKVKFTFKGKSQGPFFFPL